MKIFIIFLLTVSVQVGFSQTRTYSTYYSNTYKYSIEYPSSFTQKEIIGKNVDFKVIDGSGNNIVIAVQKLPPQESQAKVDDLLEIPESTFETNSQLPNVDLLKRGIVYVDNVRGVFQHFTSKGYTDSYASHFISYTCIFKGYVYNLTATCDLKDLAQMQPVFFRAFQSFSFPK
jgi:hypothetical protein